MTEAKWRQRTGAASPVPAAPDLLQQLRALGLNQGSSSGRISKTYAGLAAAGRNSALGQAEGGVRQSGGGKSSYEAGALPESRGYSGKDKAASGFFQMKGSTEVPMSKVRAVCFFVWRQFCRAMQSFAMCSHCCNHAVLLTRY